MSHKRMGGEVSQCQQCRSRLKGVFLAVDGLPCNHDWHFVESLQGESKA